MIKSIGRRQTTMSDAEHDEVEGEEARSKNKESTGLVVDAGRYVGR
jgi:hypothetical protein